MASTRDNIELRHHHAVLRTQQSLAISADGLLPSDSTLTLPIGYLQDHPETLPPTSGPNDDETSMKCPLLSRPTRSSTSIGRDSHIPEINRTVSWDQSRSSVEYSLSSDKRVDLSCQQDEEPTRPKQSGTNKAAGRPKQIARSHWSRYLHGWIIHVPALLMTVVILVVGSLRFYWYPENGPFITNYRVDADTINNVLQLVAKLHELLIVASLSSIALAMFRRSLVTSGVRLGFLTGGYRVGDLNYLGTAAFWRQGFDTSNPWGMLLPGFVVFGTIMSTIVGPASAVLLVPTLGWFDVDPSIAFSNIELPLMYSWDRTDIWFPGRYNSSTECRGVEGIYQAYCPAGGFPEISNWVRDYAATDLRNNLTFHSTSADLRRHLVFTQTNDTQNNGSITLCTTPPHFLTTSIGLFQKYIDRADVGALSREPRYRLKTKVVNPTESSPRGESRLYQPFVQSKCTIYDKDKLLKDTASVFYPNNSLNCFNDVECQYAQKHPPIFNKTWLTYENLNNKSVASTYWTGKKSPIVYINGQIPDASLGKPKHVVYLCSLLASWAPSEFSVDPSVSDAMQSTLSHDRMMRELYYRKSPEYVQNLRFAGDWFESLNPSWNMSDNYTFKALSRIVINFSSNKRLNGTTLPVLAPVDNDNNTAAEIFLAKVFGVYLTEGVARSTYQHRNTSVVLSKTDTQLTYINLNEQHGFRGGIHELTYLNSSFYRETWRNQTNDVNGTLEGFIENLKTHLPIYIVPERYGYGSGQVRRTLTWAQAMMYIYLGSVAIYASGMGIMSLLEFFEYEVGGNRIRVLSIIPWADLQDLMILALKTPVPNDRDLADAGAGVTLSTVWTKTVRAGADEDFNAQLVLEETKNAKRLDVDCQAGYY